MNFSNCSFVTPPCSDPFSALAVSLNNSATLPKHAHKKKKEIFVLFREKGPLSVLSVRTAHSVLHQPAQPASSNRKHRKNAFADDRLSSRSDRGYQRKRKKNKTKNEYRASKEYNHRGRAVVGDSRVDWRPQVDGHINDFLREARGNAKPVFLCISLSSAISPSLISSLSLARTSLSLPTVLPRVQSYIYSAGEASPHPTTLRLRGSTIVSVRETTRDRARLRAGRGGGEKKKQLSTKRKEERKTKASRNANRVRIS